MPKITAALSALLLVFTSAHAGEGAFSTGPRIEAFGSAASVDTTFVLPDEVVFRHSFDVKTPSEPGQTNSTFGSAARFINMHARAGVATKNMHLAVVIHGKAVFDVTNAARFAKTSATGNANTALITALIDNGVQFIVCGQSAAYYDVAIDDLLPGVKMALSAMTAHALLQQQGYTLNPF